MAKHIVAYVGYECFDIILYLSRILQKLERKVLVVDYSKTGALASSVGQIKGIDREIGIISYRGIDYTSMMFDEKIVELYDDIIINCGFSEPNFNLPWITKTVFVTNMFKYNLERLNALRSYNELMIEKALLIKDAIDVKISPEIILGILEISVPKSEVSVLYRNDRDYEHSLICHYNQVFRLRGITRMLKLYLFQEIKGFCTDITGKQIKKAFHKASKGD